MAREAPTLVGRRVVLRSVRPADVPEIVDISVYDGVSASSEAEVLAMLRRIEADAERGDSVHWGICLAERDVVVGTIGFYRGFHDAAGEVGYVMRSAYRRRGLMREALGLVVAHGFERLGLAAIVARTSADNVPSIALLRRIGFARASSEEALLRFVLRSDAAGDGDRRRA